MAVISLADIAERAKTYPTRASRFGSATTKLAESVKDYVDTAVAGAGGGADDTAYGVSWDGDTEVAASKNALYDKLDSMDTEIAGIGSGTTYETLTNPSNEQGVAGTSYLVVGGGLVRLPLSTTSIEGDTMEVISANNQITVSPAIGDPVSNLYRVVDGGGQPAVSHVTFGAITATFRNGTWYTTIHG